MINFGNCVKKFMQCLVWAQVLFLSQAFAGSYEDYFQAIKRDDAGVIQQLLNRGFDPDTPDPSGEHGLLIALREPSPKVANVLIAWPKTNLNRLSEKGESPLMLAAINGQVELARKMIAKDADVNKTGWTPLHYAASSGAIEMIKLLLEHHAFIDAESPNLTTPLMMAAMYGTAEAVKLLLDEGADASLRNQQGLTAMQFAQQASRRELAELLGRSARVGRPAGQW
jgi:hypothetical protein